MSLPSTWIADDGVLLYVVNVVVQITLLTAIALLAARLSWHNAALRYWALFSALLCLAVCPLLTAALQSAGVNVAVIQVSWFLNDDRPPAETSASDVPLDLSDDLPMGPGANDEQGVNWAVVPENTPTGDAMEEGAALVSDALDANRADNRSPVTITAPPTEACAGRPMGKSCSIALEATDLHCKPQASTRD